MSSSQTSTSCARLLALEVALAVSCAAGYARAQIMLPYSDGFEGLAAATLTTPMVSIAGAPDFGYYPNAESVGPFDNRFGLGGGSTSWALVFDVANNPTIINGVFVYPTATGTLTVEIRTSGNVLVGASAAFIVTAPMLGNKTYVPIDLVMPLGTAHRMQYTGTATLFGNTAGAAYPYTGMMNPGTNVTITGNTLGNPAHYHYFYDWQINSGTVPAPAVDAQARTDAAAQTGVRAVTMNKIACTFTDTQGFLVLTLDMSNYTTATPIGLHFGLREHELGDEVDPNDRVWVRGRSTDPWIEAGDLDVLTWFDGQYYDIAIGVSPLLVANAQGYTSSFQIRWGQEDDCNADGYSIDNVSLQLSPETCGNGVIEGFETCDDGNTAAGDGCSAICATEAGWLCTGSPSLCSPICSDGLIIGMEACDDGNPIPLDGCSAICAVESGWTCMGEPSICTSSCGDGLIALGAETCDDGNTTALDGCSAICAAESGWTCTGEPSICTASCGDGLVAAGAETCDDGNTTALDGCSASCLVESGWTCTGAPSICAFSSCGDGLVVVAEECDDGNTTAGDGCNPSCAVEPGFECTSEPSACITICGDGLLLDTEECDDGGTTTGDGCDTYCAVEPGFECTGEPSACTAICGDGLPLGTETCDDGNTIAGDGCDGACNAEMGMGGGAGSGAGGGAGTGDVPAGGCGCRTVAGGDADRYGIAVLALLAVGAARRRPRRR